MPRHAPARTRTTTLLALLALTLGLLALPASARPDHAGRTVDVQLLALNDLHGHLEPPSGSIGLVEGVPAGGVAYLAAHLEALAADHDHSLLVHSGDMIGGSPLLSSLFRHEPTIEVMNLLGVEVGSVGNHEFDAGFAELQRVVDGGCHAEDGCFLDEEYLGSDHAFLGANVVDEDTGEALLPRTHVANVAGARIGFVGATLEGTADIVSRAGIVGIEFTDEAEAINDAIGELRKRRIETIVVLLHQGGFAGGGINDCDGLTGPVVPILDALDDAVDVVVTGHTHQAYVCDYDGMVVTQAGAYGTIATELSLTIDRRSGDVAAASAVNHVITHDVAPHAEVQALLDRYLEAAEPLANREVGTITADIPQTLDASGQSPMGSVVADSMLEATRGDGAQVAIHNDGGVRSDLTYARTDDLPDGTVTYGDIFEVAPFGNLVVTMTMSGAELEAVLGQQWQPHNERYRPLHVSDGLHVTWRSTGSAVWEGEVVAVTLDGEPINPDATYRVATNNFLADGGSGFDGFLEGTDRVNGPIDVDALEDYFKAFSPVHPPAPDRKTRAD